MQFQLNLDIKKFSPLIQHTDKMMLMGSCFTEHIGEFLEEHKWNVLQNPNGILFNPVSVAAALNSYMDKQPYTEADLFQLNEAWHHWQFHSRFSKMDATETVAGMNASVEQAYTFLKEANWLIITLGSAWIYQLNENAPAAKSGEVAANNHKAPQVWFNRRLLPVEETMATMDNLMHRLQKFNPNLQILFTISPVRHVREGVVENNQSKAVLINAVHQLVNKLNGLHYFPAYELVIDILRDYRFYAEDMVHPNYQATEYVWERFVDASINDQAKELMKEINVLNAATAHKPFNAASNAHHQFLQKHLQLTKALQAKNPYINFEKELKFFNSSK
jgi:hypothetical protein